MIKLRFYLGLSLTLISGTTFLMFTVLVLLHEVLPRMIESSLNVAGTTMVLNQVWEGNEIYLVVVLYATLSGFFFTCSRLFYRRLRGSA